MGKKITVFLSDGTEFGPKITEISNWVGKCLYAKRTSVQALLARPEVSGSGLYFLKSSTSNSVFSEKVQIGYGENIGNRLRHHLNNAELDFEDMVFFISKQDPLSKNEIKYMALKIYEMATEAKSAELIISNKEEKPILSEADASDMDYFIEEIKLILPLMGFRFLIPTVIKSSLEENINNYKSNNVFYIKSGDLKASLYICNPGFVITKGSQAVKNVEPTATFSYSNLREKLINDNLLIDKGEYLEFAEDTVFNSPTAASNIVLGKQSAGPKEWVNSVGTVLLKQLTTAN